MEMKLYIIRQRGRYPTYLRIDPERFTPHFGESEYATRYTYEDANYVRNHYIERGASPDSLIVTVAELQRERNV